MVASKTRVRFSMMMLTRREVSRLLVIGLLAPGTGWSQAPKLARGSVVRTLTRDYAPEELTAGAILFHEHLSLGADFGDRFRAAAAAVLAANGESPTAASGPPPAPPGPDPMRDVELMAQELRNAQQEGAACIVDAGLEGTGMDINFIREAARRSSLPVVKAAGYYTQPFYPREVLKMSEEQLVRALVRQAEEYPAGAFGEIGSWDEITSVERKVFRAVGKAHGATDLPVFTHTGIPGKSALEQLDILEDAGVDPRRVAIGHLGNLNDPKVYIHKTICRRGAYVGFDRQGGRGDDQVVPMVMALLDAGFVDHILISGDASRSYGRPLTVFLPKLKAAGASDEVLHRITVDNPLRFLAFVPRKPRSSLAHA
jgi:phosphotriesterase-related protein